MRLPLATWPAHRVPLPMGWERYLQAPRAQALKRLSHSRSPLARAIVDFVAQTLPGRGIRVVTDGGYATQDCLRHLPAAVHVGSRLLSTAPLSAAPQARNNPGPGRPPSTGTPIGSATTWARKRQGGRAHPSEAGTKVHSGLGRWQSVLPGRRIRVVVVRRSASQKTTTSRRRNPRPRVEAFFTTDRTLSVNDILAPYRARWAVESDIRDGQALYGLGQAQCRKWRRIGGIKTFRLAMAAARTRWVVAQTHRLAPLALCRYRPWYRQKVAPSQLDIVWMCRDALHAAGVVPIVRFQQGVAENHDEPENTMPLAA
jgi:Transposase DDE domain